MMSRSVLGQSELQLARRIVVVDPRNMYRAGLRTFISNRMPNAEVFDASDLAQGLSGILVRDSIDLILMDLDPASYDTLEVLKQTFDISSKTRFAIISELDARANILAGLAAGFHGFISKRQRDDDILDAIRDIMSGRIYVPPSLAAAEQPNAPVDSGETEARPAISLDSDADILRLTPRQREVLSYLALGMSNKEIARALHIAEATTKVHAAALLRALSARNRTEAAFKAGKLIQSLKSSQPARLDALPSATIREDGHTLPFRLINTRPVAHTNGALRRRGLLD
jgi:DNA-binding NarL/FixJ family response regulator